MYILSIRIQLWWIRNDRLGPHLGDLHLAVRGIDLFRKTSEI